MDHLAPRGQVNGPWQSRLRVDALVVVELVGIRAHGKAADFQDHLIVPAGVNGARGNHHLGARLGRHRMDVALVVDGFAGLLGLLRRGEEFLAGVFLLKAQVGAGILPGHTDVVALVLAAQLPVLLHHPFRVRVALDGHVAAGVEGIVIIEPHGEIAAEGIVGGLAQELFPLLLHKGEEGHLDFMPRPHRRQAHLHGNHVKDPGAVFHLPGQVAQALDIKAAPYPFQINGPAAQGLGSQLVEQPAQLPIGQQGGVAHIVRGHVPVQRSLTDQRPAQLHRQLKVHIVVPAHHGPKGQGRGLPKVVGLAVLVVQRRGAGGDVHPDVGVICPAQGLAQGAPAQHQQLFFPLQGLPECIQGLRAEEILVPAGNPHAVEEHGVQAAVLGQGVPKHLPDGFRGQQQFLRADDAHPLGQELRRQQLIEHVKFRARIAVQAHAAAALRKQRGNPAGYGQRALHHRIPGRHGVHRVQILIRVGMKHKAHGDSSCMGRYTR